MAGERINYQTVERASGSFSGTTSTLSGRPRKKKRKKEKKSRLKDGRAAAAMRKPVS